jgi:hypothetical protein
MMKGRIVLFISIAAFALLVFGYLFIGTQTSQSTMTVDKREVKPVLPAVVKEDKKEVAESSDSEQKEEFEIASDAMKVQLKNVASAFEKSIKYPPWSQPLSEKNWDLLNPNAFIENSLPLDEEGNSSASLKLTSFVLFKGDPVEVTLTIQSSEELSGIESQQAELLSNHKTVASFMLSKTQTTENGIVLQGEYTPGSEVENWSEELQIKVLLDLGQGEPNMLVSNFRYAEKQAELTEINDSYVDSSELVIPLSFNIKQDGRYRVSANLYSVSTGKPLSHVYAKENLNNTNNSMDLKVHAGLLKDLNDPGPYELRDITISRLPSRPGDTTGYGSTQLESVPVNGFDLEDYSDEPYVDLQAQQRLEFLKNLGGQ